MQVLMSKDFIDLYVGNDDFFSSEKFLEKIQWNKRSNQALWKTINSKKTINKYDWYNKISINHRKKIYW